MKQLRINHLAIWIIVVLQFFIGGAWFSIFMEPWIHLNKEAAANWGKWTNSNHYDQVRSLIMEDCHKMPMPGFDPVPYIIVILSSVVICYGMAMLFKRLDVRSAGSGLAMGFGLWFAFLFLPSMSSDLFSQRPVQLTLINEGDFLVNFLISGLILGSWKKYKNEAPI